MLPCVEHQFSFPDAEIFPDELGEDQMKNKKKGSSNARRFTEEQIRSLELIFESETRLEPRKKVEVARELGLHPRQVAIWFQNKRARWRSKQVEKEYKILRASYNNLVVELEALKKQNHDLTIQLQELKDSSKKRTPQRSQCFLQELPQGRSFNISSCQISGHDIELLSQDEYFGFREEHGLGGMVEPCDSSITSLNEEWNGIESECLLDQSGTSCPLWWDFWS